VPGVSCSYTPSCGYGGCRDEPVVRPDVLAGGGEFGPDAGVRARGKQAERQRGERGQDGFDEGLTAGLVLCGCAVDTVEQFRGRDGGYRDILSRAQLLFQPLAYLGHGGGRGQSPDGAFKVDENYGV
jgi:hypothetical protein